MENPSPSNSTDSLEDSQTESQTESQADSQNGTEEEEKSMGSPSASDFTVRQRFPPPSDDSPQAVPAVTVAVPSKSVSGTPSSLFSRKFTDEDEIILLEGMGDFVARHGADSKNMNSFYDQIGDKLHTNFKRTQLTEKFRRLKQKYAKNRRKKMDLQKLSPHEMRVFQLSAHLWGSGSLGDDRVAGKKNKSKGKKLKEDVQCFEELEGTKSGGGYAETHLDEGEMQERNKKRRMGDVQGKKSKKKSKINQAETGDDDEMATAVDDGTQEKGEGDKQLRCLKSQCPRLYRFVSRRDASASLPPSIEEDLHLIDTERAMELEQQCKKVDSLRIELFFETLDFTKNLARAVVEARRD